MNARSWQIVGIAALFVVSTGQAIGVGIRPTKHVSDPAPSPIAAGGVGSCATGKPSAAPEIQLRYHGFTGDVAWYRMRMTGTTDVHKSAGASTIPQRSSIETDMLLRQETVAAGNDTLTLETLIHSGAMSVNNGDSHGCGSQLVSTKMRTDGTIIENSGFQGLDLRSMQLVFPQVTVVPGFAWTSRIPASANVPIELTVTYTVVGLIDFRGRECVRLVTRVRSGGSVAVDGLTLSVKSDGEILFDHRRGRVAANTVVSKIRMRSRRKDATKSDETSTAMNLRMEMSEVEAEAPVPTTSEDSTLLTELETKIRRVERPARQRPNQQTGCCLSPRALRIIRSSSH